MATQTTNLNLVKPDYTDAADIAVINTNMDTIDSNVHGNAVDIAGIATIITGTTNNSGHSVSSGEYFIANGAKYKATATIGTGVTWADKSSSVSDHDLINALNSKITNKLKFVQGVAKIVNAVTTTAGQVANVEFNVSSLINPSKVVYILSASVGLNPAGVFISVAQGYNGNTGIWNAYMLFQNDQTIAANTDVGISLLAVD